MELYVLWWILWSYSMLCGMWVGWLPNFWWDIFLQVKENVSKLDIEQNGERTIKRWNCITACIEVKGNAINTSLTFRFSKKIKFIERLWNGDLNYGLLRHMRILTYLIDNNYITLLLYSHGNIYRTWKMSLSSSKRAH